MRHSALIIAAIAALVLAACGDDDNDTIASSATTTAAAGDADRYCALTRELDRAGEGFFASLGEDARPEQYEAAERRFVTSFAGKLEQLEQAAPREIEDDVDTLLAGQRRRAGLPTARKVDDAASSAAEKRIKAWEQRHCGA